MLSSVGRQQRQQQEGGLRPRSRHGVGRAASRRSAALVALAALAWLPRPARADAPFGDASVDLGSAETPWSVFAADLDADGDLDVLSASQADDEVNWYENDGASPPAFTPHPIGTNLVGPSAVVAADLDGDGDLDALATGILAGQVGWFESDGASPPLFTAHVIDTQAPAARAVSVADLDRDGDTDVLAASEGGNEIIWYESDAASPPSFVRHTITTAASGATSVSAADLDGDGDLDVLSTSENDNTLAWYESDGASSPGFTRRVIFTDGMAALWHSVADLDGDGDLDIALASSQDNMISWFENDGASPPGWVGRVITLGALKARSVTTADLDGDGDIDVASASEQDDTIAWYENDGASPPAFVAHAVFNGALGASSIAAGDVDGDGDVDLLSASFNDDHIRWYPNLSIHHGLVMGPRSVVSGSVAKVAGLAVGDLDRNGALDLVSTSFTGNQVFWHPNGGGAEPAFGSSVLASGVSGASAVAVADLDGDGAPDVLASAVSGGGVIWLDGDGAAVPSFVQRTVSSSPVAVADLAVCDVDRDGDRDVIAPELLDSAVVWHRSDGALPPSFSQLVLAFGSGGAASLEAVDLDRDGDLDAVAAHPSSGVIAWHEGDGTGTAVFSSHVIDASAPGAAAVHVADLDRDGDLDVLAAIADDDTVAWYESDGAATPLFTPHVIAADASGVADVSAADLDRDGDLDVVAAAADGGIVAVYANDGATPPVFAAPLALPAASGVRVLALADLNRDGLPDVAAGSTGDDTVAWYPNRSGQLGFTSTGTSATLLLEGAETQVLEIEAAHLGRSGDGAAEVAEIALRFESPAGVPLTDAPFNALVDTVRIYTDDGSGELEIGSDPLVATFGGTKQLTDGVLFVLMPDGSPDVEVVAGGSRTFFVTLDIVPGSSGLALNTLRVLHVPGSGSVAEDRDYDIPLRLAELGNVATPMMQVVAALPACADGIDNDGDLLVDYPDDPGCRNADYGSIENPQCDDGIDNDLDTFTDHPADPQCQTPWWNDESMGRDRRPRCGLGPELSLLLPLLGWLRSRRRREVRASH